MPQENSPQDRMLGIYGIYDLVAGSLLQNTLMLFPHVAPARRMFKDAVNADPAKSVVAAHPEDHALVYLGAVSIWTLSVVDVGDYHTMVDRAHRAVICTGDAV